MLHSVEPKPHVKAKLNILLQNKSFTAKPMMKMITSLSHCPGTQFSRITISFKKCVQVTHGIELTEKSQHFSRLIIRHFIVTTLLLFKENDLHLVVITSLDRQK